mmetsp:Transcript_30513/g.93302  ORF Transcript_30513/g.93302 Transcript_30513/m.93302 type:complete len:203 (-) Transcript_30513:330-938(-)
MAAIFLAVASHALVLAPRAVPRHAPLRLDVGAVERSLSPATSWRLQLELDTPGSAEKVLVTAAVRFREEEGYEPPQGFLRVDSCLPEGLLPTGEAPGRWMLSEDPEDRKDSLWIWGLFKEPLYPFILFSLPCAEIQLANGKAIPAGTLYIQAEHRRDPRAGVLLGEGKVTYKVAQQLDADLLGLSGFTYNEPIACGSSKFLD